ncbi:hypothetical protein SELSPUOL_01914 [Selenomonas sputigena ATCC 35185]|uniref:Uncharacterized protein n=1 Tax=Selenomonas sputigena (strain ATCC 35185 / DSM 20758 / CCUG 44933 / VPI D19B-28) TaxID=546271 RepID=C9LWQ9_SELS3|nr:hypothetical protein SELSPUOL_01914 [Selenomonas sputigena ATCC 35185]
MERFRTSLKMNHNLHAQTSTSWTLCAVLSKVIIARFASFASDANMFQQTVT